MTKLKRIKSERVLGRLVTFNRLNNGIVEATIHHTPTLRTTITNKGKINAKQAAKQEILRVFKIGFYGPKNEELANRVLAKMRKKKR